VVVDDGDEREKEDELPEEIVVETDIQGSLARCRK
jgi:hypothetical protein